MKRKIITYGGYFESFKETLTQKEQDKIDYCLLLLRTQDRVPVKFISLIKDGLYELRIENITVIYTVYFLFLTMTVLLFYSMVFRRKHRKRHLTK